MGVPAFFRWLSRKYPSIVVNSVEQKPKQVADGDDTYVNIPVDTTEPNPNGVEFDNLYLDMNGIVHPCCHPEHRPPPKNEEEMMVAIFAYIDRLMGIIRPRRLLYMAIDGVAPRAKMNQQRSRRFRSSKEAEDKALEIKRVRDSLEAEGIPLPPPKAESEHFDSNCITPGTPFMARLAECLRYYCHARLNSDPAWAKLQVILSDANVPGEGEHKIMDYIRRQRASPSHDPNTHHCLCGADADLIMLGLATHEPNFTIIREEFIPHQQKPCDLCGQYGHELTDCQGLARSEQGQHGEVSEPFDKETNFIFVRLNVLREYLEKELVMQNVPFKYDFERAIDDWVFMCFFVGNDFLPHLPSLEIRENAIDRLIRLYKNAVYKTGGYLTNSGHVHLDRVQLILTELGELEDEIFKSRQSRELDFRARNKNRKKMERSRSTPASIPTNQFAPVPIGSRPGAIQNPRQEAYEMRMQARQYSTDSANSTAAQQLKAMLKPAGSGTDSNSRKRPHPNKDDDSDEEPADDIRLWESGWKERYYQAKFEVSSDDYQFRYKVACAYVEGLCWVLAYYYQGCASWKWFYPYHYSPMASDFIGIGDLKNSFQTDTKPFNPMEQLMGVFPAGSRMHIPEPWQYLMTSSESPIIDFYPENFKIDLNGKKFAWQGVALLPFVEEGRLLEALEEVYPTLTEAEIERNVQGPDRLLIGPQHNAWNFLVQMYEGNDVKTASWLDVDPSMLYGMFGNAKLDKYVVLPGNTVKSPLSGRCPDLPENKAICVQYRDPQFEKDFVFPAKRLSGAVEPERTLKPGNWNERRDGQYRPQTGFTRNIGRGSLGDAGHRMLKAGIGSYSNMPPPQFEQRNRRDNRDHGGGRYHNRSHTEGSNYNPRYEPYSNPRPRPGPPPVHWNQAVRHQGDAYRQNQQHHQGQNQQYQGQWNHPPGNRPRYPPQQQNQFRRPSASDYF